MKPLSTPAMIFTVGHSTRTLDDFVKLLRQYDIGRLVDVRTIPRSRHNPQFNKESLGVFLRNRGIAYRHMKELGGLRHARTDSPNTGWHNASFRGFADYMLTAEFSAAIDKLIGLAGKKLTVIMCAESVPWRCHRSLIGDALLVRGMEVRDIFSSKSVKPHTLTPMAVIQGIRIIYPSQEEGVESRKTAGLQ